MSALRHFRIVELSERVAGEYCGKLLADFGAELIKVERPGTGSPTRALGPFLDDLPGTERSGLFAYLNTNKRSVALDLASEAGRTALHALLRHADAVIDDHAPGWLEAIGLDPDRLAADWPGLVMTSVTPFGRTAPADRAQAEALTVMHSSGWGYHTPSGSEPDRPPLKGAGRFMADYEAGLDAATCTVAALIGRGASGAGRAIDISGQEVMASRVDYVLGQMVAGDMDVGTSRTQFDLGGPAGIFPCRAGFVYIWMSAPGHWQALRTLLGGPAWMADFPDNWLERGLTPERLATCRAEIGAWLLTRDKDEAAEAAQRLGLTLVPVNDPSDLLRSPQYVHRGYFAEVDHPVLGKALYPTVPYRLSLTPARIERAAPLLDADATLCAQAVPA
jgi:crotonobetainyl-CoA:carnitine CoA-transferase CaiB-like acyl-CoA transferase